MNNEVLWRRMEQLHAKNAALDNLIAALIPHDPEFVRRKLAPRARRGAAALNADLSRYITRLFQ